MKPEEAIKAIKGLENIIEYWTYRPDEVITAKLAIEALEKQVPKKPITDGNIILCPECNLLIAYNKSRYQHCWTCGQSLEGCVIK